MATSNSAIYQAVFGYIINSGEMGVAELTKMLDAWKPLPVDKCESVGIIPLVNLCANLRKDMASTDNKTAGKGGLEKAMLSVINNAPHDELRGAFMQDGMQCVCDGYRIFRINEPINLPEPITPNSLQVSKLYRGNTGENLELPELKEVRAFIKVKKAENKALYGKSASKHLVSWDFGENKPLVDASYLADVLLAFPDAQADYINGVSPILFTSSLGDALLLPVRRQTVTKQNEQASA